MRPVPPISDLNSSQIAYLHCTTDGEAPDLKSGVAMADASRRAMRRMGELIKGGQESGQIAKAGQPKKELSSPTTFLSGLGVTRDASSLSQKIAAYVAIMVALQDD